MADGVEVTKQDLVIARDGIYLQAEALIPWIKGREDIEQALKDFGIEAFIENQITVKAADMAYNRIICSSLHSDLNREVQWERGQLSEEKT